MVLTGKQKAAMLLIGLDAITASELLKGVDAKVIRELAVELTYLEAAGYRDSEESVELAREFYNKLQGHKEFHIKDFLSEMLRSTVGDERARQIQDQIQDSLRKRDPFITIRTANSQTIALILRNEHPQAIAVVLSALSPKKSSEVLGFLEERLRYEVVSRITDADRIRPETKTRIARMVCERLEAIASNRESLGNWIHPEQSLRKVAVILRNLGKELREGLLTAIHQKDNNAGKAIANLMITWSDIAKISDKSLRTALRGVEPRRLAVALTNANDAIKEKITSNISGHAREMLDEESKLMSVPRKNNITLAREGIIETLRKFNQSGEISFIEE